MERNLDFDTVIERSGTNCLKYDFAVQRGKPEGLLSLWVADMDFRTSSYIQDAIREQAEHGIYGYSESGVSYFEAVQQWLETHYQWKIKRPWLIKTPGIVFALAMAVQAYTEPGDGVMLQLPVYYPFSEVIQDNGRRIVNSPLVADDTGYYRMNPAEIEDLIVREQVKLFFLCNPHNPVGRVWTREELETLGDICHRHHVIVVSDEIHADYTFQGTHHIFAGLKPEYEEITVTCTAPTKTFNIAGLQISNILIPNRELRHKFRGRVNAAGYSQVNAVGLVACEAAYRYGEEWYQAAREYIWKNICYTVAYIRAKIPELKVREPEGTYLVWIDFRELGLSVEELEELIVKKAGLWLDSGAIFGSAGTGYQRINVACPRSVLTQALEQLEKAVHTR